MYLRKKKKRNIFHERFNARGITINLRFRLFEINSILNELKSIERLCAEMFFLFPFLFLVIDFPAKITVENVKNCSLFYFSFLDLVSHSPIFFLLLLLFPNVNHRNWRSWLQSTVKAGWEPKISEWYSALPINLQNYLWKAFAVLLGSDENALFAYP